MLPSNQDAVARSWPATHTWECLGCWHFLYWRRRADQHNGVESCSQKVGTCSPRELVHNYRVPSQAVGPTAPSRHWIRHSTPGSVGTEQVWYLYPIMRLSVDISIQKRFDFVCWNETEEQRTEGARDVTHMNTHTNAQWNRPPGSRGQSPTQSRTQPRTNAMILISNLHLSLTSNISKSLDINHDINIKVCKHMIEFNIK